MTESMQRIYDVWLRANNVLVKGCPCDLIILCIVLDYFIIEIIIQFTIHVAICVDNNMGTSFFLHYVTMIENLINTVVKIYVITQIES